jgi:hypothetical protein
MAAPGAATRVLREIERRRTSFASTDAALEDGAAVDCKVIALDNPARADAGEARAPSPVCRSRAGGDGQPSPAGSEFAPTRRRPRLRA